MPLSSDSVGHPSLLISNFTFNIINIGEKHEQPWGLLVNMGRVQVGKNLGEAKENIC